MLTFLHTVYCKNRMDAWGCCAAEKKQERYKYSHPMFICSVDLPTFCKFPSSNCIGHSARSQDQVIFKIWVFDFFWIYANFWGFSNVFSFDSVNNLEVSQNTGLLKFSTFEGCNHMVELLVKIAYAVFSLKEVLYVL